MKIKHRNNKGFTLVELLVVIVIIAVLAALATPAILAGLKRAKITKAVNICTSFEGAVTSFEVEYNYLPFGGGGTSPTTDDEVRSNDDVVAVLAGAEDELNFKQVKFFETEEPTGNKDGMEVDFDNGTATLYDPWGELYFIIIDYDLDGRIDDPFDEDRDITRKVAIYSLGADREGGTTIQDKDNASNY